MQGTGWPGAVRLERPLVSRLRLCGLLEACSYLLLIGPVLVIWDAVTSADVPVGGGGDVATVVAVASAGLAVRVSVWTEYVEADALGLRWRSLFRPARFPWQLVESIDVARMALFPSQGLTVLRVRLTDGTTRKLRCSAGCGRTWTPWMRAVRLLIT